MSAPVVVLVVAPAGPDAEHPRVQRVTLSADGETTLAREHVATVAETGPWTRLASRCPTCGGLRHHARMLRLVEGRKTVVETECEGCGLHEIQHERGVKRDWSERAR